MPTLQSCHLVPASSQADDERLVTAQQDTHLTRSMPSKASDSEAGSLVTTASLATHTPCSLAPISAPQSQEGLLSTTAWVFGTCSISMYVHCRDSSKRESLSQGTERTHVIQKVHVLWTNKELFKTTFRCHVWTFTSLYCISLGKYMCWCLQAPRRQAGPKWQNQWKAAGDRLYCYTNKSQIILVHSNNIKPFYHLP